MPKLSFIVTSYNYADYVKDCIESILAQTYPNIEIIVVDDGSKTELGILVDEKLKKFKNTRVVHKENGFTGVFLLP